MRTSATIASHRFMARYLLIFLFCLPAFATNYTVKASGGGNFTTMSQCATQMSTNGPGVSDTCTVFAGAYNESVTVPAGSVGNYKIFTVNASDVVSVHAFTLNSHTKVVGNCPMSTAYGSCGFSVGNTSSPNGTCFSAGAGVTDFYVAGNTMEACVFFSTSKTTSYGYFQQNTMAYSCSTPAAPNVCTAAHIYGSHYLWDSNDISHVSDGPYLYADHVVYRKNLFHNINTTDCGSQSSNCHVDFVQTDANANGGDTPAQYMVFEKNITNTMIGGNMHAIGLFQGEVCGGNCHNAILRFHETWNCAGCAGIVADNSEAACPAWDHIKSYNNTWVDTGGGTGNIINNVSYCTTYTAFVNEIYYWHSTVSNTNGYSTVGGGGSSTVPYTVGFNIGFTTGGTAASIHPHTYGSGSWTVDAGNLYADPVFNNYAGNDFSLTSSSPARNKGTNLTTVSATVSSSTTITVADPDYFQDGYGLAGVLGDCILVTSLGNSPVCITNVNYATGVLTLSSAISAVAGDKVWLYSISDGSVVQKDTGVDIGAIPFVSGAPVAPTVATTTVNPASITATSAVSGGTVTSNGGATITAEGVAYGTSANPTSPCTGSTGSPYTVTLSGLTASTLYHYRACATNSVGTGYGADQTFTTLAPSSCSNPVLSPAAPASATGTALVTLTASCTSINYCTDTTNTCTPSIPYAIGIALDSTQYVRANASQAGFSTSGTVSGLYTVTVPAVQLPQNWVNNLEWIGTTVNTINFPASSTGGSWTCGTKTNGPYTAGSQASLQQAVNDAETCRTSNGSGTTIVVPAGATFSGTSQALKLPQTAGDNATNFIVLISSTPPTTGQTLCSHGIQDNVAASTQPGIRNLGCNGSAMSYQLGTTVTTIPAGAFTLANGTPTNTSAYNDLAELFTLTCTSSSCNGVNTAVQDANGISPHHFAIIGAEIKPQAGLASPNAPVKIGQQTETAPSQFPSHIHIAYSYLHGDWTDAPVSGGIATGPPTGANSLPNGISFSACNDCSISYSYLDRLLRPGAEGHAIYLGYWNQIKVVHNWAEGQSIGLFSGGFASTVTTTGFGNDVEDRGNRYTYPYSWLLANQAGFCVNGLACSGNGYERKNSHEFKNGNRILEDGNIYENVDNTGGQNGINESWKANNCSNGFCNNYWLALTNLTVTNGVHRNTCAGMSWGFRSATDANNGGGVTLETEIALVQNNLSYNIDLNGPGCSTASPEEGFRINQAGTGNTWAASCTRDAVGATSNCTLTTTPGGTQSNFNVGDPVYMSGCTDTSFNTNASAMGPLALTGTNPNGLVVVYSNPGTANATSTGCTVSNLQGWPQYLTHLHNSEFVNTTSASSPYSTANNGTSAFQLGRNLSFTDDIFVGGGITGGWLEGTRTETKSFDPTTEAQNNTLYPGRDSLVTCPGHTNPAAGGMAACYTEYSNSSVASTPATLYGVPTSYCTGNDPTVGSCVGVLGAMSQGSFPSTLLDWHQYRLCHSGDAACNSKASIYSAGQTNQWLTFTFQ